MGFFSKKSEPRPSDELPTFSLPDYITTVLSTEMRRVEMKFSTKEEMLEFVRDSGSALLGQFKKAAHRYFTKEQKFSSETADILVRGIAEEGELRKDLYNKDPRMMEAALAYSKSILEGTFSIQ